MSDQAAKPHSAEFFGPERDHWWNLDHLMLIASRLGLESVGSVLDVGCGVGHWGRLLSSVLPPDATLVGVDQEPEWVVEASSRAAQLAPRFRYERGRAEELAFPDDSFDLVTCQTLLIHVDRPGAVIKEMLRVTKPGGLILVAEPNNRVWSLVDTSTTADAPIEDCLGAARFLLTCERGKIALGEGNNSVGDLVPGYLAEQGAIEVQTFICDKPAMLVAPYDSAGQQALRNRAIREAERETRGWDRGTARRYFIAGGGSAQSFDAAWEQQLQEGRRTAAALVDGSYHTAGGLILYLIAGRKP
jgi:SAM-dependent methyltransferase